MVNIVSFNVRDLANHQKRKNVLYFLKNKFYDIICIQESHATKKVEKFWKTQFGGQILYANGESNARGVMIMIKRHVKTKIFSVNKDSDGRILAVDLCVNNVRFVLCNIYAPNTDCPEFFRKVQRIIESFKNNNVILLGDFNTPLRMADKVGGSYEGVRHIKSVNVIEEVMELFNLIDIWRCRNPGKNRYTWFKVKPTLLMERLDYILVSANLANIILDSDIDPKYASDHALPHITLKTAMFTEPGPGYWKLDTRLLQNQEFKEMVLQEISSEENSQLSIKEKWELVKMKIRGNAIKLGARNKKSRENKLEILLLKQYRLTQELENRNFSRISMVNGDLESQLELITKDIEEIIEQKAARNCR